MKSMSHIRAQYGCLSKRRVESVTVRWKAFSTSFDFSLATLETVFENERFAAALVS